MKPSDLNDHEIDKELTNLRLTEIESRERIQALLSEYNQRRLWKLAGFRSVAEYLTRSLGYGRPEGRELLIGIGAILPQSLLSSPDPVVCTRIENLRSWRKKRASLQGIAAYRIFSNRTLLAIAEAGPRSLEDLEQVSGLGEVRVRKFGNEILTVLQS